MYQASEQFGEAILGTQRSFCVKITASGGETESGIRSIRQYSQANSAESVSIGGAVASYVEVEMWKPDFSLENTELTISIGMTLDGSPEWIPLGLFTVQKPENDDGFIRFVAYDRIQSKMGGAYFSDLAYPADGKQVLVEMAAKTGVTIRTDNLPDGVMIPKRAVIAESGVDDDGNEITNTTYTTPFDGYTYREALGYIAALYGKFAVADRTGTIELRWYEQANYSINSARYYDDLTTNELVFSIGAIVCQTGNESLRSGTGTDSITIENPVMTQERLDAVYQQIKDLSFLPAGCSFFGDPRLDLGDIVTVNDKHGNVIHLPVMYLLQDYDGGLLTQVQSQGQTEEEAAAPKGPTAQKLDRVYTDLFLVKELIGNKASFDYVYAIDADFKNVKADYGEYKELTTGQISAVNGQITNLSGDLATYKTIVADNFTAANGRIDTITGDLANYKTVVAGNLQALGGQIDNLSGQFSSFQTQMAQELVAAKGWMLEGSIGSAQISDLDVNKLNAGTIDTAVINLASADSALQITGSQILVNDASDPLTLYNRVILGKYTDGAGAEQYGLLVRSADGQTVMIDGDGVHNAGITDGAIDNNKVADNANISGKKLDIQSVVTEINEGETKISQTMIQVGDKSLDIVLGEQTQIIAETGERLETIESSKMYRIETAVTGRQVFDNRDQSAVIVCRVYSWDNEITGSLDDSLFSWHRDSGDPEADAEWDSYHAGMKQVTITTEDILHNASFRCDVNL